MKIGRAKTQPATAPGASTPKETKIPTKRLGGRPAIVVGRRDATWQEGDGEGLPGSNR